MRNTIMFSAIGIMAVLASVTGTHHPAPSAVTHSSAPAAALASSNAGQNTPDDGIGWD